jgi:uncharacterized protein with FMN-binding domain
MSKSSLYLFAAVLTLLGASILTGHPPWGAVTGISILLMAAALATGAIAGTKRRQTEASESGTSNQKLSAGLVTLSATAVLAVYAAGFQRTRSAADQFDAQDARRQTAPTATVVSLPTPPAPMAPSQPTATPKATRPSKDTHVRPSLPQPAESPQSITSPAPPTVAATETATAIVPIPPPAPPIAALSAAAQSSIYKDGTFTGWGRCRHGSIQASIAIENGRIVNTEITQCLTRYSCSWIANLPGEVVTRQSANIDYVSGATESTDAFYEAVASALASAHE